MTRDDIIKLARESMVQDFSTSQSRWLAMEAEAIERFYRAAYAAGAKAEREACARVCEQMDTYGDPVQCWLDQCAAAIRTRSET